MNTDCIRHNLIGIESKIKAISGYDIDYYDDWASFPDRREEVRSLLESRRNILNDMFFPSEENIRKFKAVNEHLYSFTTQLRDRVKQLEEKRLLLMDCSAFDDDYEVYGTLRYCFNGEESVLNHYDDRDYSSDFVLMIKLLPNRTEPAIDHQEIHRINHDSKRTFSIA